MDQVTKHITFDKATLPTISVCIIAKNEEKDLPRLLNIIHDIVDEIIVVDTGSTDRTKEIALSYGAKVYDFPWIDDFSAARNESLRHATKDYILWLDADDTIEKQDIAKLKFHIKNNMGTAAFIHLSDRRPNAEYVSLQLRVFPNHLGLKFAGRVHEQISLDIEEKGIKYSTCPINVIHLGYNSLESINKKLSRNINILLEEIKDNPDGYLTNLHLAKTYIGLEKIEEARPFAEKAVALVQQNKAGVSKENSFLAVMSKVTILLHDLKVKETIEFLEGMRSMFSGFPMFKYTIGEIYFRDKKYEKAYKNLLILKGKSPDFGLVPINPHSMIKQLTVFLMVASLHVGDFRTAEYCISTMINDTQFKIKR
jgi:glycosyltransferase involved in cell wall biosynthesis